MAFEKYLVDYCSPTLASVKTANLFNWFYESSTELWEQVSYWNLLMNPKGVYLYVLKEHPKKALIYVCRKSRLAENLCRPGVAAFLAGYGYGELDVDAAIERLKSRFDKGEDFPHEIGVFLDYPLGDVIGFIENSGHNYKCSGCWKVYCDECESRRLFAMYQKCRDIYTRLYEQGRSVFQLTVAA